MPFIVGGDHSLALGSIAGASKFLGNDLAVIWIDAHGDINTHETSPSGNIHGMPLAASMGIGYKKLTSIFFDSFKVKPENVFILACRDLDDGEVALIDELNMNVWTNKDINDKGTEVVINELLSLQGDNGGKRILKGHLNDLNVVNIDNEIELFDIDTQEEFTKASHLKCLH